MDPACASTTRSRLRRLLRLRLLRRFERPVTNAVRGGVEKSLLQGFPEIHVALGQIVQHRPRRLAEDVVELTAELLLLIEEDLQALLEIAAHETLQRIAVETDDLREEI